jgi:hypothetical protein
VKSFVSDMMWRCRLFVQCACAREKKDVDKE